ncbi:sodium:dicarboxylate symporter protein [Legionella busanensis]|uniref:Sodium:dicarboxylate symporter protein n=1 Tax=Legionella busanensis TaxID=190655 RepID=A0A378KAK7_9GAMM|nr:dicarboxylate/amino acid:cation symporter [Legionella busanensis]STX81360.1 sodium:dicarboxylate symporter protein [Legionella busanensis]
MTKSYKSFIFPLVLLSSIILGGITGYWLGPKSYSLKPLGDIFINLILTIIVPLIFFSISSAIARTSSLGNLSTLMSYMTLVFILTSLLAALYALFVVLLFPPTMGGKLNISFSSADKTTNILTQIVSIFTVLNFSELLSHQHMLALIIFSMIVGTAITKIDKQQAKLCLDILYAGETVLMKSFNFIMYYAPIGFFAYFAVLVGDLGTQIIGNYLHITILYYVSVLLYFIIASTLFAFIAEKRKGVFLFWSNISTPMLTSLATCSSAASIPANLEATKKMQVPTEIADITIPFGSLVHKDGSVIGGIFKIAFLFELFHLNLNSPNALLTAIGVSLLVGTVMGAIPSGGMLGELLILSAYNFPSSVLIAIAAFSLLIDPLATMINVTGNSISAMIITRLMKMKKIHQQNS